MHLLLHLKKGIESYGPLVNCNQFWVERYIGFIKFRFNSPTRAAESLTENAKLLEAYKLFFGEHFVSSEESIREESEEMTDEERNDQTFAAGVVPLNPMRRRSLSGAEATRFKVRDLLISYIARAENLEIADAEKAVVEDCYHDFWRLSLPCGAGVQHIGSVYSGRKRKCEGRDDFYIAAEFDNQEETMESRTLDVYYGRVLLILQYNFKVRGGLLSRCLFVGEWAGSLKKTALEQVYKVGTASQGFGKRSIEDASVILHQVGLIEHVHGGRVGAGSNSSRQKRSYFLDPLGSVHGFFNAGISSPDGRNRMLSGLH